MTFEKHLLSVSREATQRLGFFTKSCRVFHGRSLLGRCFRGFVLPVFLEYCSEVWCSAADKCLKLQDSVVSDARLLTGGALSVKFLILDLWQYIICCTRSGVTDAPSLLSSAYAACARQDTTCLLDAEQDLPHWCRTW